MPLPEGDTRKLAWPPTEFVDILRDLSIADAWYSGDENKLLQCYFGVDQSIYQPRSREKSFGVFFNRGITFWSRRANEYGTRQLPRLHVPVAGDIAAKSSDFLFGEEPTIRIAEAHLENPDTAAEKTEARLKELLNLIGFESLMAEAAELSSGIGGVYLVPGWDASVANHPIIQVVAEDQALPKFNKGILTSVTFWREVKTDGDVIWRHLEVHDPGVIYHGLYKGFRSLVKDSSLPTYNQGTLGVRIPLDSLPETAGLEDKITLPGQIKTLLPNYIPNRLPNRKRRLRVGEADSGGLESLMDALDEVWTSWMRDIRLGQAKIAAPTDWLTRTGRGQGASLDIDQDIFIKLDVDPMAEKQGLDMIQFAIRYEEHSKTCLDLFHKIVGSAGYAPQSFGVDINGQAESGTALKVREAASYKTTKKKRRYFEPALESTLWKVLTIDREVFNSGVTIFRPQVTLNESENDITTISQACLNFSQAEAASIETLVRMAQPELDGDGLKSEVQRIKEEKGMLLPDPTGRL